jgi:hypothetical protein
MTGFSLHLSLLHAVRPLWYAMSRHVLRWNTNVSQTLLMCMHWLLPVLSSFKSENSTMLWAHAKTLAIPCRICMTKCTNWMVGVKENGWSPGNHQFDPYPSDSLLPILEISPPTSLGWVWKIPGKGPMQARLLIKGIRWSWTKATFTVMNPLVVTIIRSTDCDARYFR